MSTRKETLYLSRTLRFELEKKLHLCLFWVTVHAIKESEAELF